ncbi:MAG: hypothetical protein WCV83_01960 [Candidatus Magasanikbacteria bacterium]
MNADIKNGGDKSGYKDWKAPVDGGVSILASENGDDMIVADIIEDPNGERYYMSEGKKFVIPEAVPSSGDVAQTTKEQPIESVSPEITRRKNIEDALNDKLIELFQDKKSSTVVELMTREIVRDYLATINKNDPNRAPGQRGFLIKKSPSNSVEAQAISVQQHLEMLLGSGSLVMMGEVGGKMEYAGFSGAKKGEKQTIEVPVSNRPNDKRVVRVEFTPLVVPDKKNPDKVKVVKVLCESVKITE